MNQFIDNLNQFSPKSLGSPINDCEKSKKYDRQLRLWGDQGQYKIELSNICLINANALGTEIIKNLVLPGIGSFTIVDSAKITSDDDNNFFINKDSIGQCRAKTCMDALLEMNSEVRGDFIEDSIESLLETNPTFFSTFSVVVACNVYNEKTIAKLSKITWENSIPFLICFSIGFVGYLQLQVKEHVVIDSHPDYVLEDLRLDKPFPDLKTYLEKYSDFDNFTINQLSHLPYIIIIYKYLKIWQSINKKNENQLPSNYSEKNELRKMIENEKKRFVNKFTDNNHEIELENFNEAIKAINQVLVNSNYIPEETKNILNELDNDNHEKDKKNKNFWFLIKALKHFLKENDTCLPLKGRIPDMSSDSATYIELQNMFKKKSKEDSDTIFTIVQNSLDEENYNFEEISETLIREFSSNTQCLRLIRTEAIYEEYNLEKNTEFLNKIKDKINISNINDDSEANELIYYLLIRSILNFYSQFNRLPGNEQMENDIILLKNTFNNLIKDIGCNKLSKDDYIHEFCRYGGCELHSVSSFISGIAGQEIIKLVTGQYVPFNNIFIYNAITSKTKTFNWKE